MSLQEDLENAQMKINELQKETLASEFLSDYKKTNKRLFILIIIILMMWFATIGTFLYYIDTHGMEETQEIVDIENENGDSNGCIGDNCNSGVINGESKTN